MTKITKAQQCKQSRTEGEQQQQQHQHDSPSASQSGVASLSAQFDHIMAKLESLNNKMDSLNTKVDSVSSRMDTLEARSRAKSYALQTTTQASIQSNVLTKDEYRSSSSSNITPKRKMYLLIQHPSVPHTDFRLGDIILHPTNAVIRENADFPKFEELNRDGSVYWDPDHPPISREFTTPMVPWTGYFEKHSSRSADFLEVLKLGSDGEHVKAGLMKYAFNEVETHVLNNTQDYIKRRSGNPFLREEMEPPGGLPRKPVRTHLKGNAVDLKGVSCLQHTNRIYCSERLKDMLTPFLQRSTW